MAQQPMAQQPMAQQPMAQQPMATSAGGKSKVAAGVLGLFIPGAHRMYLGFVGLGILQFCLIPFFLAGALWSWIESIQILTGSFDKDANGQPLS